MVKNTWDEIHKVISIDCKKLFDEGIKVPSSQNKVVQCFGPVQRFVINKLLTHPVHVPAPFFGSKLPHSKGRWLHFLLRSDWGEGRLGIPEEGYEIKNWFSIPSHLSLLSKCGTWEFIYCCNFCFKKNMVWGPRWHVVRVAMRSCRIGLNLAQLQTYINGMAVQ